MSCLLTAVFRQKKHECSPDNNFVDEWVKNSSQRRHLAVFSSKVAVGPIRRRCKNEKSRSGQPVASNIDQNEEDNGQ